MDLINVGDWIILDSKGSNGFKAGIPIQIEEIDSDSLYHNGLEVTMIGSPNYDMSTIIPDCKVLRALYGVEK